MNSSLGRINIYNNKKYNLIFICNKCKKLDCKFICQCECHYFKKNQNNNKDKNINNKSVNYKLKKNYKNINNLNPIDKENLYLFSPKKNKKLNENNLTNNIKENNSNLNNFYFPQRFSSKDKAKEEFYNLLKNLKTNNNNNNTNITTNEISYVNSPIISKKLSLNNIDNSYINNKQLDVEEYSNKNNDKNNINDNYSKIIIKSSSNYKNQNNLINDKFNIDKFELYYKGILNKNENLYENLKNEIFNLKLEIENLKNQLKENLKILNEERINNSTLLNQKNKEIIKLKDELKSSNSEYLNNIINVSRSLNNFINTELFQINNENFTIYNSSNSNQINLEISSKDNKIFKNNSQKNLFNKLNLNTNLNINYTQYSPKTTKLSNNLIFSIYNKKQILIFDIKQSLFRLFNFSDISNFFDNYQKNGNIFLNDPINNLLYIVTGKNFDKFYIFDYRTKSIQKYCDLNNNHKSGNLIYYYNTLYCISGNFNKKIECFDKNKNQWFEKNELNYERCEFSSLIYFNKFLFILFGFNMPKKMYLNSIEYININEINYKKFKVIELINNQINLKLFTCLNYNDEKIIFIGGKNNKNNIENFYQLIINENFENDKSYFNNLKLEKMERKLKDIYKNKKYLFNQNFIDYIDENNKNLNKIIFDENNNIHIFQINNMLHDIYYFYN